MTRLAGRLLDHAARVMPGKRRDWARAMRAELAHIATPLPALAFALGCVRVSYGQRVRDMASPSSLARWTLAAYALACAGCYALATVLTIRIKTSPRLRPQDLGSDAGAGGTLLFLQGYPMTRLAILPLVAILLAAGAVLLARRRPTALPLLASGAAGATLVALVDQGATWPLAWSSGWVIPLLCLVPAWRLSRRPPDLSAA